MPLCPRCRNPIAATDLVCPACKLQLKAHGHPAIDLHQALGTASLCQSCAYHVDDSCTFPQRPNATACTLYQSVDAEAERVLTPPHRPTYPVWQRYRVWILVLVLFGISLLLTIVF